MLQMHKALVAAQGGISNELHASFQGMLLAMQDVPAVLIVLADSLQVCASHFGKNCPVAHHHQRIARLYVSLSAHALSSGR